MKQEQDNYCYLFTLASPNKGYIENTYRLYWQHFTPLCLHN